eukprot:6209819-Pleurochrysis_carterae.AAC.3
MALRAEHLGRPQQRDPSPHATATTGIGHCGLRWCDTGTLRRVFTSVRVGAILERAEAHARTFWRRRFFFS